MGRWSPENTGGRWLGGVSAPAEGARFKGTNRAGKKQWSTAVRVVQCEPGRAFAFEVSALGMKVARWSYEIEPTAQGCSVTETWTDRRVDWVKPFGKLVSGVAVRDPEFVKANMETTLANLAGATQS
jgi:hypothetical protein